ncbi:LOW QUALITY PROTEIN: hypothetical protein V2J09_022771 [Rumex salicifolius]
MESEVRGENTKVVGQLPYRWGQDPVVPKQPYTNEYVDNSGVEERHCGSAGPDQKLKFGMHKPHFNIDRDVLILRQNYIFKTLDKTISSLEMESAASRASKAVEEEAFLEDVESGTKRLKEHPKVFFVMGVIIAFSSRKHRDSIRETWMPRVFYVLIVADHNFMGRIEKDGEKKGIVMLFIFGHRLNSCYNHYFPICFRLECLTQCVSNTVSASPRGVLDQAIDCEEKRHKDFLRLINLDYEWKAQAENPCAASFYWSCSGICKSVEKMMDVHQCCREGG